MVISQGQSTATITVTPVNDTLSENDETVVATLSSNAAYVIGAPSNATVTVLDNDIVLSVAATDNTATEYNRTTAAFTITRSGGMSASVTALYQMSGTATQTTDYGTLTGQAVIPANQSSVTVLVTPVDDYDAEAGETAILTLTSSAWYVISQGLGSATATIVDNDTAVSVTASQPNASEQGPVNGVLIVARSGYFDAALTVNYSLSGTATFGSDYQSVPAA